MPAQRHSQPLRLRWVKGVCVFRCNLPSAHFWHNDRSLLRATAETRGWNGHRIRVSKTKLTLDKKILPQLLPGFDLATFRSRVRRFTNKLSTGSRYFTHTLAYSWHTDNHFVPDWRLIETQRYDPNRWWVLTERTWGRGTTLIPQWTPSTYGWNCQVTSRAHSACCNGPTMPVSTCLKDTI